MKIILADKNIVFRVVLSTDLDFDKFDGKDFGHTVANNFDVSVGDYVSNYPGEAVVRQATKQDFIDRHGSQETIFGDVIKPFLSGFDLTGESDEFNAWVSAISNESISLADEDSGVYLASEDLFLRIQRGFGIVDIKNVIENNKGLILPPVVEETTTTTAAPTTTTTTTEASE